MMARPHLRVAGLLLALVVVAPPALGGEDVPPDERAALARVLAALEARPPETARDYRVALHELNLVGDAALPYLRGLLRRYVDGPGLDDVRAHAFLGDRHFDHPVPEAITFRGHPFLRAVEAANAKAWFRADEETDWILAQAALSEMRRHHRRLVDDHRYRAGDQVFANVAHDPFFRDRDLRFTWADPFALVQVGPPASSRELPGGVESLRRGYRAFLAEYGERLGLRDLMEPWGGRADFPAHVRSYAEGAPLLVFLYAERELFEAVVAGPRYVPPRVRHLAALLSPSGRLHVAEPDRLVEAGMLQILHWFARQQSRWGRPPIGHDALADGFGAWLAARLEGAGAERSRLEAARAKAAAFRARERPYPVIPMRKLVTLSSDAEIARTLQERGVPTAASLPVYREQSWALARMLCEHESGRHRDALLRYVGAWLRGETRYGMTGQVFRRAFGLHRDDADAESLEATWAGYLEEEVVGPETQPPPPRPRPLHLLIRRIPREGVLRTEVRLRDSEAGAEPLAHARLDLLGADATAVDRVERTLALLRVLGGTKDAASAARPPVAIRHLPARGPFPPWEDMQTILVALLRAGYRDLSLEGETLPLARTFLDTWTRAQEPAER